MFIDLTWVILHGGENHQGGGASFEAILGSLVVALVVTGVLWYLGVFHALEDSGSTFDSLGSMVGGDADAVGEAAGEVDGEPADHDAGGQD
jgi:hypothetical protein